MSRIFAAGLVLAVVLVSAPSASAQDDPVVPDGVTISGVPVGGLTEAEARAAVREGFARPLAFRYTGRTWRVAPRRLVSVVYVAGAVRRALAASPGDELVLAVRVNTRAVSRYAAYLGRVFSRRPVDSRVLLRRLRPFVTRARPGASVKQQRLRVDISSALRLGDRGPVSLRVRVLRAKVTRANIGAVVVIRRGSKGLYLYRGMRFVRRFGVATGQPSYPTPIGRFSIVVKARNPWWYPPSSDWADGLDPIPPGPGNPLGTRWMGLSVRSVGIHGTPDAASIGYSASHGCIRMRIGDAEWLFERVTVGTPVFIVRA